MKQAVWCIFKISCMWSVLHLSKYDKQLTHILKNTEARKNSDDAGANHEPDVRCPTDLRNVHEADLE